MAMTQPAFPLETPVVTVDLDMVENNLRRMQTMATQAGLMIRPHTKTHKMPGLARRQVELGATGITVAKLDEAEVMLEAGLTDILIAYPLVGAVKAHRLASLMARGLSPTVALDSRESLDTVSRAARLSGHSVGVLVEVDTGFHRLGLIGPAVADLAELVSATPGVQFRGLMSFAGHIAGQTDPGVIARIIDEEDQQLARTRELVSSRGVKVEVVSVGGTILANHMHRLKTATEVRPGIYIFNDRGIVLAQAASVEQCATRIWTTVVSRPAPDRLVLDAGSKMLSTDGPLAGSYGLIVEHPDWRIIRLSEEHAVVALPEEPGRIDIGRIVSVIPNHVCTVMNLQNRVIALRHGKVETTLAVTARGGTR